MTDAPEKEELITADQTQFGLESPLFDSGQRSVSPHELSPEEQARRKKRKLLIGAAVGGGVVLVSLIILAAIFSSQVPTEKLPAASAEPRTNQVLTPLEQKIEILRQDLRQADPTTQDLPFPPVDLEIELDTIKQE